MSANTSNNEVHLHHYLDASIQQTGGTIELDTPAGPLSMTLPPGLTEGQTLRLVGRGDSGPDGRRGDVLLTLGFFSMPDSVPLHVSGPPTTAVKREAPFPPTLPQPPPAPRPPSLPVVSEPPIVMPQGPKALAQKAAPSVALPGKLPSVQAQIPVPPTPVQPPATDVTIEDKHVCPLCGSARCKKAGPVALMRVKAQHFIVPPLECPDCHTIYEPVAPRGMLILGLVVAFVLLSVAVYFTFIEADVLPWFTIVVIFLVATTFATMSGKRMIAPPQKTILFICEPPA